MNFIGTSTSPNDYVELYWTGTSTDLSLTYVGATGSKPASPSVIVGLEQIMYTQLGPTGATGPQGEPGPTGATGATGADTSVVSINSQAGNYTLALSDKGNLVEITAAGTVTVPLNSSVAFPVGSQVIIVRATAGVVDIAGAGGVTLNSANSYLDLNYQYSSATLIKKTTDEWYVFGDLKP